MKSRDDIIANAQRIRRNIRQIFTDAAHWNEYVRQPNDAPIDPDPDGSMQVLLDGLSRMLKEDTGVGPIPPIGGWSAPVELAKLGKTAREMIH